MQGNHINVEEFIESGNQLLSSGLFTELIGFCVEIMKISDDKRISTLLTIAESALENKDDSNTVSFLFNDGFYITGYKHEFVMQAIFNLKHYYEQNNLQKWFRSGEYKTVFDIGANIGNHTLFFASNSPDAEIYSFEPMPENYNLLKANVSNNNLDSRVHLYNNAVGSEKGIAHMKIMTENNYGTSTITEEKSSDTKTVEVVAIDDLDLPVPDFVKIDTEGYEVNVLRGMAGTLEKSDAFVWIEIDAENAKDVYQIMDSIGYEVVDYSLDFLLNVLFGKKNQNTYPVGYGFENLLKWSIKTHENIRDLYIKIKMLESKD